MFDYLRDPFVKSVFLFLLLGLACLGFSSCKPAADFMGDEKQAVRRYKELLSNPNAKWVLLTENKIVKIAYDTNSINRQAKDPSNADVTVWQRIRDSRMAKSPGSFQHVAYQCKSRKQVDYEGTAGHDVATGITIGFLENKPLGIYRLNPDGKWMNVSKAGASAQLFNIVCLKQQTK